MKYPPQRRRGRREETTSHFFFLSVLCASAVGSLLRRRFRKDAVTPAQHPLGSVPAEAGIADRNSVAQFARIFWERLVPLAQEAFHHQANQRASASGALFDHTAPNILLAGMLFGGVGVAAIDHQHGRETGLSEFRFGIADALVIVIRLEAATPKDDVTGGIPCRADDTREAVLV